MIETDTLLSSIIAGAQEKKAKKIVTIETGTDKKKGYLSVDAYAIYNIFSDEEQKTEKTENVETKPEQPAEVKVEAAAEAKNEEEVKESSDENKSKVDKKGKKD